MYIIVDILSCKIYF